MEAEPFSAGEDASPEDEGVVACVCGATRDTGDGGFLVQCANPLCRVWQHGQCVGLSSLEEAERADFFCDACRGLSTALRPAPLASSAAGAGGGNDDDDALDDVPLGLRTGDAKEAAQEHWRRTHDARKCAAVLQHALAGDCAPQLMALLECSRKKPLLAALGGDSLGPLAARAGAAKCLSALLRRSSASAAEAAAAAGGAGAVATCAEVNGVPVGTPAAALYAALESGAAPCASAVLREFPGLLAACCQPGFGSGPAAGLPKEQRSWTPLHAAAAGASLPCVQLVIDRVPEHVPRMAAAADAAGLTPLMLCAGSPNSRADGDGGSAPAAFLALLEPRCLPRGASAEEHVRRADAEGLSAAHLAAASGACGVLRELHRVWGGCIHAVDHQLATPLHVACSEGKAEAVRLLLQLGALATARDEQQWVRARRQHAVSTTTQHTSTNHPLSVVLLSRSLCASVCFPSCRRP